MSFELRIFFTGLVLFRDAGDGTWRALLVDARERDPNINSGPHQALIQFDLNQRANPNDGPFLHHPHRPHGVWFLDREIVEIQANGGFQPPSLQVDFAGPSGVTLGAFPQHKSQVRFFDWVTPVVGQDNQGTLVPGQLLGGLLNPVVQNGQPTPLAATVKLEKGHLRPVSFGTVRQPVTLNHFGQQRIFASVVFLRTTVEDATVDLVSRHFNGNPGKSLTLKPDPHVQLSPGETPFVEVWVFNIEPDQYFLTNEQITAARPRTNLGPVNEFKYFHKLLTNPPSNIRAVPTVSNAIRERLDPALQRDICEDSAMDFLFFQMQDGQSILAQPCSPAT